MRSGRLFPSDGPPVAEQLRKSLDDARETRRRHPSDGGGYYWAYERIGAGRVSAGAEVVLFTKTDMPEGGGYVRRIGDDRMRMPGDFEWGPKVACPLETEPIVRGAETSGAGDDPRVARIVGTDRPLFQPGEIAARRKLHGSRPGPYPRDELDL